jgi:hypothetical protein
MSPEKEGISLYLLGNVKVGSNFISSEIFLC